MNTINIIRCYLRCLTLLLSFLSTDPIYDKIPTTKPLQSPPIPTTEAYDILFAFSVTLWVAVFCTGPNNQHDTFTTAWRRYGSAAILAQDIKSQTYLLT